MPRGGERSTQTTASCPVKCPEHEVPRQPVTSGASAACARLEAEALPRHHCTPAPRATTHWARLVRRAVPRAAPRAPGLAAACLAKRPAGPVGGAAWSCGGCLYTSSTDFKSYARNAAACSPPPVQFLSRLPQSDDLESTDGPVRVHARRLAMGDVNISKVQVIWVPNAI